MDYDMLRSVCMAYENKLKELMGEDAFHQFSSNIAKSLFAQEIRNMVDGEFKDMVLENFDAITGTDDDYQDLIDSIQDNDTGFNDHDCGADY